MRGRVVARSGPYTEKQALLDEDANCFQRSRPSGVPRCGTYLFGVHSNQPRSHGLRIRRCSVLDLLEGSATLSTTSRVYAGTVRLVWHRSRAVWRRPQRPFRYRIPSPCSTVKHHTYSERPSGDHTDSNGIFHITVRFIDEYLSPLASLKLWRLRTGGWPLHKTMASPASGTWDQGNYGPFNLVVQPSITKSSISAAQPS
jgi:hypothetical protein